MVIYFPENNKELQKAIAFDEILPVIIKSGVATSRSGVHETYEHLQVEVVYIDNFGNIVGDEANDYQPKGGEMKALLFS